MRRKFIVKNSTLCKLQAQAGRPIPGHRLVLVVDQLVLVALWKPRNARYKKISNIHIDVKFFEEAESDLIFSIKSVESGQKRRFIEAYRNSGKLDLSQKINFFDHFRPTFAKK